MHGVEGLHAVLEAIRVAPAGRLLTEKVSGKGPSTSVALTVKLIDVPSFAVIGPGTVSTGGSFTGVTVIEMVAVLLSSPSLTTKLKLSGPE